MYRDIGNQFRHHFAVFLIGALGFVIALNWQDTIKTAIDTYFPSDTGIPVIIYKLIVSISLTIVAIPFIYILSKLKVVEPQPVKIVQDDTKL